MVPERTLYGTGTRIEHVVGHTMTRRGALRKARALREIAAGINDALGVTDTRHMYTVRRADGRFFNRWQIVERT